MSSDVIGWVGSFYYGHGGAILHVRTGRVVASVGSARGRLPPSEEEVDESRTAGSGCRTEG
jgi:hypothetical protein